jgi:hypothetical protein
MGTKPIPVLVIVSSQPCAVLCVTVSCVVMRLVTYYLRLSLRAANYLLMVEMDYQMCQNRTKIDIG